MVTQARSKMVIPRQLTVTMLLTGFALLAASCGGRTQPPLEQDLAAIADFNARYLAAINNEDIAALSALTTEGHIMLAPNRKPIIGKAANDEANGRAFEQFDIDESWTPEETVVTGDWAYQRGSFKVVARPKSGDGAARTVTGSFLRIYQRQPNGDWRMIRDMFNSDGSDQGG